MQEEVKMMSRLLRNESTEAAREIWRAVDNAAAKAPDWLRKKIEEAPINMGNKVEFAHKKDKKK